MTVAALGFSMPRLRDGVKHRTVDSGIDIDYRRQGCCIDVPAPLQRDIEALFLHLQNGDKTIDELLVLFPCLAQGLPDVLAELDRLGLLIEADIQISADVVSGLAFYHDLRRFVDRARIQVCRSDFYNGLTQGILGERELIGYVLEYYHIVSNCPRLLAPALSHATTPRTDNILRQFFVEELHHDKLIERSLLAVGIAQAELRKSQPLASTFSVYSALGVWARQDPLAFKSLLFVFEDPAEALLLAIKKRCDELAIPESFYEPLITHAGINDGANHDAISEQLLAEVPCVSAEEQSVIKKHALVLIESLAWMESEILNYYGNKENPLVRAW